jgi:hypothetical protein
LLREAIIITLTGSPVAGVDDAAVVEAADEPGGAVVALAAVVALDPDDLLSLPHAEASSAAAARRMGTAMAFLLASMKLCPFWGRLAGAQITGSGATRVA